MKDQQTSDWLDRRGFLRTTLAAAGGFGLAGATGVARAQTSAAPAAGRPNPIAVSSYSFWRYNDATKLPVEKCLELASDMGFDGFEILHVQMTDESNGYLQMLKRRAFVHGLAL